VLGAALAGLALAGFVAADWAYGRNADFATAVVVAPVLAAVVATPMMVAVAGLVSTSVSLGLALHDAVPGAPVKVSAVAIGTVVAVALARYRVSSQERAARLRAIADAAEGAVLRPLPNRCGPASLAGWHISATEDARISGDFYDAVQFGGSARWVMGDTKGHGIEVVKLGTIVVGAFREAACRLDSLEDVVRALDDSLRGHLGQEDFVTAVVAELDQNGTLSVISCGHPAPVLLTPSPRRLRFAPTTPLGVDPKPAVFSTRLRAGAAIWFYTDGVSEARVAKGGPLHLHGLAGGLAGCSAEEAVTVIEQRLRDQTQRSRFDDDVSILVVRYRTEVEGRQQPRGS
jgi:serine phosphatase RsbU (regulator of sigma subunit)